MNAIISKAVEVLKAGGVVLLPTDTVCGITTAYGNDEGLERIYRIKERDSAKPVPVLVPDIEAAWDMAEKTPAVESELKARWPGAATFVLNNGRGGTVGVRMPDCGPLLRIMEQTGPLWATSANLSGENAPAGIDRISDGLKERCDYSADLGITGSGSPSEVIDLSGEEPRVLRSR